MTIFGTRWGEVEQNPTQFLHDIKELSTVFTLSVGLAWLLYIPRRMASKMVTAAETRSILKRRNDMNFVGIFVSCLLAGLFCARVADFHRPRFRLAKISVHYTTSALSDLA